LFERFSDAALNWVAALVSKKVLRVRIDDAHAFVGLLDIGSAFVAGHYITAQAFTSLT